MSRIRVGIAGATGYAGQELLRLTARHPHAEITVAMASSTNDGARRLPELTGLWDGTVVPFSIDTLVREADVVFLALPENVSANITPRILEREIQVFDLSGSFRLRDTEARRHWYPKDTCTRGRRQRGLWTDGTSTHGTQERAPCRLPWMLSDVLHSSRWSRSPRPGCSRAMSLSTQSLEFLAPARSQTREPTSPSATGMCQLTVSFPTGMELRSSRNSAAV